ncbi:hypothetical protein C1752_03923 [Acaryochloris thomasi RCC1774]|uniref:Uncharacterized protein n=1 Tax=Acaryochloris thomasi RCC1774 TaxID=1764569 RepID=A0A2W1JFX4_9CYAN|nr:hypothetical protein [Acaryochloris thomasi]PZD72336.1 hypothetical protein C1752_03923 [Acaryochloris thomasi RCC1774]
MNCRIGLTETEIDNLISVLYLQTAIDDQNALALLDRLTQALDQCIAESKGRSYQPSAKFLEFRQQLNRQLYAQMRSRSFHDGSPLDPS